MGLPRTWGGPSGVHSFLREVVSTARGKAGPGGEEAPRATGSGWDLGSCVLVSDRGGM